MSVVVIIPGLVGLVPWGLTTETNVHIFFSLVLQPTYLSLMALCVGNNGSELNGKMVMYFSTRVSK